MIPETLMAMINDEIKELGEYEEMLLDSIKEYEQKQVECQNKLAQFRAEIEKSRKERSELRQFLEENGVVTEKK